MISVDKLIKDLTTLNIDHQEVFVEVEMGTHRGLLGSMQFGVGGTRLTLVAEPRLVPDPVVPPVAGEPDLHKHTWRQDWFTETWKCAFCDSAVLYEDLRDHPIPSTQAEGVALLDSLAR